MFFLVITKNDSETFNIFFLVELVLNAYKKKDNELINIQQQKIIVKALIQ
jgi:hypothetical protein